MKTVLFAVSIDVECDHSLSWAKANPLTFRSVTGGIPQRLQPLFNDYGVKPTYLLTVEVLESLACLRVLTTLHGEFELGIHLHPEYVQPARRCDEMAGSVSHDFQLDYSRDVLAAKLDNITELFEEQLGYQPTSFRAGRFGIDERGIEILEGLGYKVDTSVTPLMKWRNQTTSVDFKRAPAQPYFPNASDVSQPGPRRGIVEVPVSIVTSRLGKWMPKHLTAILSRLPGFRGALWPRWLRPSDHSFETMKSVVDTVVLRYGHLKQVYLNMMLHSMEVISGASPYALDDEDVGAILASMERLFQYCRSLGNVRYVGLSEMADCFAAGHSLSGILETCQGGGH